MHSMGFRNVTGVPTVAVERESPTSTYVGIRPRE